MSLASFLLWEFLLWIFPRGLDNTQLCLRPAVNLELTNFEAYEALGIGCFLEYCPSSLLFG